MLFIKGSEGGKKCFDTLFLQARKFLGFLNNKSESRLINTRRDKIIIKYSKSNIRFKYFFLF